MRCFLFLLVVLQVSCGHSQDNREAKRRLVGTCEGCEAIFEYGSKQLRPVDTLPGFGTQGDKLKLNGTVYDMSGKPAAGVVLYIYHTNLEGIYEARPEAEGWERRHGSTRGWVKTGADGAYTFYTYKPGHYPGRTEPAHIHLTVLEPNGKYYWLPDFLFEGDPLLKNPADAAAPRGGSSGVLQLNREGNILTGSRDIYLGRNVPSYE